MKHLEEKYQDRLDHLADILVTPERYAKAVERSGQLSLVPTVVEPETGLELVPQPPEAL